MPKPATLTLTLDAADAVALELAVMWALLPGHSLTPFNKSRLETIVNKLSQFNESFDPTTERMP